jgi:hypothetical protein
MVTNEELLKMAGFPIDPRIDALEQKLSDLAVEWRRTKKKSLVTQYHNIYRELQRLGWNGRLDLDSCLPDHLMPSESQPTEQLTARRGDLGVAFHKADK